MITYFKWLSQKDQVTSIMKWIVIILVLIALIKMPYTYYEVVRRVVSLTSIYFIYEAFNKKQYVRMWAFLVTAIMFNPISTPHLTRRIWCILNILVAVESALSLPKIQVEKKKK